MLNEWIRNLPEGEVQEIAAKAPVGAIRRLAISELQRRQGSFCSAA